MRGNVAAIYARKSTDQSGISGEAKSVTRQIDGARSFAIECGFVIAEEHIYTDDGISGAEFERRPGFQRLMAASETRAFDVLIISEESRLGRESIETSFTVKRLSQCGVRLFSYLTKREVALTTAMDKAFLALQSMAADMEREHARHRTYDAMQRKARLGHVTGGRVFGFDNIEVRDTLGKRSHVERRIRETEAAVVRRIFELYASGRGFAAIAKQLNDAGVPTPRPQRGRPAGWCASSLSAVLRRPLYAGVVVWNRTRKRNDWGQVQQRARPDSDRIEVSDERLRIIHEPLWQEVQARLLTARERSGGKGGRPVGSGQKYLLTGFLRCAECGAGIEAHKTRGVVYLCSAWHRKGRAVCTNSSSIEMAELENAVLDQLGGTIFDPAVLERAMQLAEQELSDNQSFQTRIRDLQKQKAKLEGEISRLVGAVAEGGAGSSGLLSGIQDREAELKRVRTELSQMEAASPPDLSEIRNALRASADCQRTTLRANTAAGRELLAAVIGDERLEVRPENGGWEIAGSASLAGLLRLPPHNLASPQGLTPFHDPLRLLGSWAA